MRFGDRRLIFQMVSLLQQRSAANPLPPLLDSLEVIRGPRLLLALAWGTTEEDTSETRPADAGCYAGISEFAPPKLSTTCSRTGQAAASLAQSMKGDSGTGRRMQQQEIPWTRIHVHVVPHSDDNDSCPRGPPHITRSRGGGRPQTLLGSSPKTPPQRSSPTSMTSLHSPTTSTVGDFDIRPNHWTGSTGVPHGNTTSPPHRNPRGGTHHRSQSLRGPVAPHFHPKEGV